jgi:CHAT domain-containing protein/Tfp pilus assembly protein PilF
VIKSFDTSGKLGIWVLYSKNPVCFGEQFILDFADAGVEKRKRKWLDICRILANFSNDETIIANVSFYFADYLRLVSESGAEKYLEEAFDIFEKINDPIGMGRVHLFKAREYNVLGEFSKAEMYLELALQLSEERGDCSILGEIYSLKGEIFFKLGMNAISEELLDLAESFFNSEHKVLGLANVYKKKGDIFLISCNYPEAENYYAKALKIFEEKNDLVGQGDIYKRKGDLFYYTGFFTFALGMYETALQFYVETRNLLRLGNVYWAKGNIYSFTKKPGLSRGMYRKALELYKKVKEPLGIGNVYKKLGDLAFRAGDNESAFELYEKALTFFVKVGDPLNIGNVIRSKGEIYLVECDYQKAFIHFENAAMHYKSAGDKLGIGNTAILMGELYIRTGDNYNALRKLEEALAFVKKTNEPIGMGYISKLKGVIFSRMGLYKKAHVFFDNALSYYERVSDATGRASVLGNMGDLFSIEREFEKAEIFYKDAFALFKENEDPIGEAGVWFRRGLLQLECGDFKETLAFFNRALLLYRKSGSLADQANVLLALGEMHSKERHYDLAIDDGFDAALSIYKKLNDLEPYGLTLHKKAKLLLLKGFKARALKMFERAIKVLEKVRSKSVLPTLKKSFLQSSFHQYHETSTVMLQNGNIKKGFKLSEMMRARMFLDQLREGFGELQKGLPSNKKKLRKQLLREQSGLSQTLFSLPKEKKDLVEKTRKRHGEISVQLENLVDQIRLRNPLYASVRYPEPVSVQLLQKKVLKDKEILLQFFLSPKKLYVFLISKKRFKVFDLNVGETEIVGRVEEYQKILRGAKNINTLESNFASQTLYKKIFKPLEKYLKGTDDLIIVPDGELALIPFEGLIVERRGGKGRPVYLLDKYRIKYIQSASVLGILREQYQRNSKTNRLIGFGDPVYDYENFSQGKPEKGFKNRDRGNEIEEILRSKYDRGGGKLNRIKGTGEEVRAIAQFFEGLDNGESVICLRENALEDEVKAGVMKDFDYIHFACHSLLSDGFQSLVLSQDIPNRFEDGYLTLNEMMNCDFNAKLVVLSACQTGAGKLEKGEGVTGLTRAVMYAGTPAVVASLWKVDDNATKELMVKFYENMLRHKMPKAEALRQAKLSLLNSGKYSSPRHWSAFVMYGE